MLDAKLKFRNYLCSLLFFALGFFALHSQQVNLFYKTTLAEKIYLQLDSDIYAANETIWFKAVVSTAVQNEPSYFSGVLYVELINQDEEVLEKKLIRLDKGIGDGFFELSTEYTEGTYLIRAYTEWNKNFDSDFIFEKYIRIFNSSNKAGLDPFTHVNLKIKNDQSKWLTAELNPSIIDSLHKNKTTLYISMGGKIDSLTVKKNQLKKYVAEYPLTQESNFVTLQLRTKSELSTPKTIVVNHDYLDFQFFPESGDLVHGLTSTVGFKVVDANGKGKRVQGNIIDDNERVLTTFKSNELGMGKFDLSNLDSLQNYFAQIQSFSEENVLLNYPLPKAKREGSILSITRNKGRIKVHITSNRKNTDSVFLKIARRGQYYYLVRGKLKKGELEFDLETNNFPDGVLDFTLFDRFSNPLLKRLYYHHNQRKELQVSIETDKELYEQRALTKLNISTTDYLGNPQKSSASLLVIHKDQKGELQGLRENIVSYFLLSSDIKGTIENPGHYYKNGKIKFNDLDALLLTQGWSKYNYTEPLDDKFLFEPEKSLHVSGKVSAVFSKKKMKKADLTLMTFGKEKSFQKQTADSLGRFKFDLEATYGQQLKILIQSANKTGKNKNYTVILDKKVAPSYSFDYQNTIYEVDSIEYQLVQKNLERNKIDEMFEMTSDVNQLDEAVVTGYAMTPQRTKVMEEYGKPDVVIDGKKIREKEKKWSYGLYSVLMFNFPDKVNIVQKNGVLRAELYNGVPTLVVVDGIPVLYYNYSFIPSIPPSEVKSFEIIEYAKNFSNLFLEVFPQASPFGVPPWGNVIAIYTHAGKGLFGVQKPVGLLHASVPVFSPKREFYKPKYENLNSSDWLKPDLRALVHWEPTIAVDSLGTASTTYYNADNLGETMIVIEAISENGEVGYKEFTYSVEKKDDKE